MNSRERVLAALNHKEPDRVPFDLGGTVITGIHHKAYTALRDKLGLPAREPKIIDMIQQLALVEDDVMDRLGVDVKNISPRSSASFQITVGDMGEYTYFYDEFKIGWRSPKDGGWYYDMFDHPLKGEITEARHRPLPAARPAGPRPFRGAARDGHPGAGRRTARRSHGQHLRRHLRAAHLDCAATRTPTPTGDPARLSPAG